jgi:hypothetical protein
MNVHINDAKLKIHNGVLNLWTVTGIPETFYPTKIAAEVAARARFPADPYYRVSYKVFNVEEQ